MIRKSRIVVTVDSEELEKISQAAKSNGETIAGFMRRASLKLAKEINKEDAQ